MELAAFVGEHLPPVPAYGELGGGEGEERALIDAGAIRGIGFLYVGEPRR